MPTPRVGHTALRVDLGDRWGGEGFVKVSWRPSPISASWTFPSGCWIHLRFRRARQASWSLTFMASLCGSGCRESLCLSAFSTGDISKKKSWSQIPFYGGLCGMLEDLLQKWSPRRESGEARACGLWKMPAGVALPALWHFPPLYLRYQSNWLSLVPL